MATSITHLSTWPHTFLFCNQQRITHSIVAAISQCKNAHNYFYLCERSLKCALIIPSSLHNKSKIFSAVNWSWSCESFQLVRSWLKESPFANVYNLLNADNNLTWSHISTQYLNANAEIYRQMKDLSIYFFLKLKTNLAINKLT